MLFVFLFGFYAQNNIIIFIVFALSLSFTSFLHTESNISYLTDNLKFNSSSAENITSVSHDREKKSSVFLIQFQIPQALSLMSEMESMTRVQIMNEIFLRFSWR